MHKIALIWTLKFTIDKYILYDIIANGLTLSLKPKKESEEKMNLILSLFFFVIGVLVLLFTLKNAFERGKNSAVIPQPPPPPPPEPKIFGLQQAFAANQIADNDDEAVKLEKFVTQVLGYENTVEADALNDIRIVTHEIDSLEATVTRNKDTMRRLEEENHAHLDSIDFAKQGIKFKQSIMQRFGKK